MGHEAYRAQPRTGEQMTGNDQAQGRPTVAVVGGGYGGVNVAKALDESADVVLVEPRDAFMHNVAALRALVDPSWLPRIYIPYDNLLANGRVVRDRAALVEPGRVVTASGEEILADYVVLATGSSYPFPAKTDKVDTEAAHDQVRAAHLALSRPTGSSCWERAQSVSNWPGRSDTCGRRRRSPSLMSPARFWAARSSRS
jgi:NADPH-dependent 2,4-dienoyl-CoA reductase/sulfur reductase-like enzyme